MRIRHRAIFALLFGAPSFVHAQRPMHVVRGRDIAAQHADARYEAAAALQGTKLPGADTAVVLDSALIEEVARAIGAIRQQVPDLKRVGPDRMPDVLRIALDTALGARIARRSIPVDDDRWRLPLRHGVPVTGEPPLDSLGRQLGAVSASLSGVLGVPHSFYILVVYFGAYVNVPNVARAYRHYPGVSVAMRSSVDYTYADLDLAPWPEGARDWRVTFAEGRGDCASGCTGSIKSIVRYERATRHAVLVERDTTGLVPGRQD